MTEYVHLIGAEAVQSAGVSIRAAAEQMSQAATSISYSMEQLSRLVERLEVASRDLADAINAANPKL